MSYGVASTSFGVDPFGHRSAKLVDRLLDPAVELDAEPRARSCDLPRISILEPAVGDLDLRAVHDPLVEDPVVVTQAVAVRGVAERGERVEKARSEPSKPAVAEAGVPLRLAQVLERVAELFERLLALGGEVEVDQAVAERASDQILEREVVDALGVLFVVPVLRAEPALDHPVADGECQRDVRLPLAVDVTGQLGQRVLEVIDDRFPQGIGIHAHAVWGRGVSRQLVDAGQVGEVCIHLALSSGTRRP